MVLNTSILLSFGLLLSAMTFWGCSPSGAVSEGAYRQALDLVDQGTLLLRARRLGEADAAFALAYEMAPLAAALDGRGCVALVAGDLGAAEEFFLRAYTNDGSYDHALGNLALVYEVTGRPEMARWAYRALLARQPQSSAVRHNLAALEYDGISRNRVVTASDKARVRQEFLKSAALSEHGVIADNITRLERGG